MKKLTLILGLLFSTMTLWAQNDIARVQLGFSYQSEWNDNRISLHLKKPSASILIYVRPNTRIGRTGYELVVPFEINPRFDTRWLWGFTLEADEQDFEKLYRTEKGADGKAWFTIRYENHDFSADCKIPLAYQENGIRWYPQLTLEGLRVPISKHWFIDSKLQYDGEFGFRENTGILYKNQRSEVKLGTNGFSAKYLYRFESIGF